jgi:hypothetical protein
MRDSLGWRVSRFPSVRICKSDGVAFRNAAMSRLRRLLGSRFGRGGGRRFVALFVVPAFMLVRPRRDMPVYEQAVVFASIARQSCSVARRKRRAVDRNSLLALGGLAASGVGLLLMDSYLTRGVDWRWAMPVLRSSASASAWCSPRTLANARRRSGASVG